MCRPYQRASALLPSAARLTSGTSISIEPITNKAPGGIGNGYRLLPAGLVFAQPVTLTIGVGGSVIGTSLSGVAIAWQGSDKIWQGMISVSQADTAQRSVSATITHFTDFAPYRRWYIVPDTVSVKVRQTASFVVYTTDLTDIDASTILSPLPNPYAIAAAEVNGWAVQHIPGGNAVVGTISGTGASATYTAPVVIPDGNPVEVEATVDRSSEDMPDLEVTALVNITGDDTGGTGEELKVHPANIKETYLSAVESYHKELQLRCAQYHIDLVDADIHKGFYQVLQAYLIKRNKMS